MIIPSWVLFLVATWVIAFGAYRLSIVWRRARQTPNPDRPQFQTKGLWGQSSRRHILFGLLYLILGAYLVAMGLGYAANLRALFGIGTDDKTPPGAVNVLEPGADDSDRPLRPTRDPAVRA